MSASRFSTPKPHRHVEHRRRLVGDDQSRPGRERPRDCRALALPARELVRATLREHRAGRELHALEQRDRALVRLGGGEFREVQPDRPLEVMRDGVEGIERGERVLEHHLHRRR